MILGMDTSCYTTSVALVGEDGSLLADARIPLKVEAGGRGLRQSEALFQHVQNLPGLMEGVLGKVPGNIAGICASARPRPQQGSYMPVFTAGHGLARSLASALDVPLWETSHQEGHIAAAAGAAGFVPRGRFLAMHVSGGTTEILSIQPREAGYDITLMGATRDLHAGQVVDRIGVAMGLAFPAGPALEALAGGCPKVENGLVTTVRGADCHLSGIEAQALRRLEQGAAREEIARAVLEALGRTLGGMVRAAAKETGLSACLMAGGVMSNAIIRNVLLKRAPDVRFIFAPPRYCSDNAVGCARIGLMAYTKAEA
nr:O-sialoglycoprotein endopeptidase [bacterium]